MMGPAASIGGTKVSVWQAALGGRLAGSHGRHTGGEKRWRQGPGTEVTC